jgi:CTP-dependent riboflavin kinase
MVEAYGIGEIRDNRADEEDGKVVWPDRRDHEMEQVEVEVEVEVKSEIKIENENKRRNKR